MTPTGSRQHEGFPPAHPTRGRPSFPVTDQTTPAQGIRTDDKARLVFIQVSGAEIAHVCRDIAADDCDVAIADDADQALTCLTERAPDLVVCRWATWCHLADRIGGALAQGCPRRPLLMLLIPGRRAEAALSADPPGYPGLTDPGPLNPLRFIPKPGTATDQAELASRWPGKAIGSALVRGEIQLDLATYRVLRAGKLLRVPLTCFRILHILMEEPERVYTREHLIRRLRGERRHIGERTIDVQISRLRKALTAHGGCDPIRTVHGVGYAFCDGQARRIRPEPTCPPYDASQLS